MVFMCLENGNLRMNAKYLSAMFVARESTDIGKNYIK